MSHHLPISIVSKLIFGGVDLSEKKTRRFTRLIINHPFHYSRQIPIMRLKKKQSSNIDDTIQNNFLKKYDPYQKQ
jgi:hypothetical protein